MHQNEFYNIIWNKSCPIKSIDFCLAFVTQLVTI